MNKRKEENVPVAAKTVQFTSKPQRPEFSVLLDRARELQPAIRAAARDTETNRRVSKKTMDLLREAELTKLVRPARFGGCVRRDRLRRLDGFARGLLFARPGVT